MESTDSIDKHKDVMGLVKEIYHEWGWGKNPGFIEDIKAKEAKEFALQFHHGMGRYIRNTYGFWKGDTELYRWMVRQGVLAPDNMSHKVFLELYQYARKELGIENSDSTKNNNP